MIVLAYFTLFASSIMLLLMCVAFVFGIAWTIISIAYEAGEELVLKTIEFLKEIFYAKSV
jgi:hypothetical protein